MAKRRKYSDDFKGEAVGPTRQPTAIVSQVARDIGVTAGHLFRWRREMDSEGGKAFPGIRNARDQKLLAVKRELAKVKKERDGLRDAAAIFARQSSGSIRRSSAVAACIRSS